LGIHPTTSSPVSTSSLSAYHSGIAANCTVSGQNPRTVTVPTSGTTTTFSITCTALPPPTGDLTVTAATSGQDLDPDGYTVTVDEIGRASRRKSAKITETVAAAK